MKFRKITSAALAAAMLAPSLCIVSYAEQNEAMKRALTYVKERISVPEELSEFNHSSRLSGGKTRYTFTWSTPGDAESYESLSVSITGKVITSYSRHKSEDIAEGYSFAKLEPEEIVEKAKEAVKMLNPTVYEYIEVSETPRINTWSSDAYVTVKRVKDGIPVTGSSGSVILNKNTGELTGYNLNWILGAGFADPEDAVSVETAQAGFKNEFPAELLYTTEYDWETNELIPHLIYRQSKYGEIDALTGKLSTFEDSYFSYDDAVDEEAAVGEDTGNGSSDGGSVNFTPSEIEKLEKENKLITADEAIKLIQEMGVFNIPEENVESTYSSCSFNERLNAYTRYVSFQSNVSGYVSIDGGDAPIEQPVYEEVEDEVLAEVDDEVLTEELSVYGSFTVNAETGAVLSYNCNSGYMGDTALKSENKAAKLISSYFNKIAGDLSEEFPVKNADISYGYEEYDNDKAKLMNAYANISRYVNDIRCDTENASLTIDESGKVSYFNMTYYGVEYPAPDKIISADEAYEKYFEQVDYDLRFRCALKDNKTVVTAMVYTSDDRLNIDAFSGALVKYNGGEYVRRNNSTTYTDLSDSKYKHIAEKLAVYGIILMDEEGRLNADKAITRSEFRTLASAAIGVYGDAGKNPDSALSRQYAAKLLTSNYISDEIASLPIFKSTYSDVKEDSKYAGYIAAADALGFMSGSDGRFNPSAKVSRGQALTIFYNILSK